MTRLTEKELFKMSTRNRAAWVKPECAGPIYMPVRAVSTLNAREHWAVRSRRASEQRETAYTSTPRVSIPQGGLTVLLTRIGPRELDGDNLQGSLKSVRDGIAEKLGINDNDPRVRWEYAQRRGKAREYAVLLEMK